MGILDRRILAILALGLLLRVSFAFFFQSPQFGDEMWHYLVSRNLAIGLEFSSPYVENYWGDVSVPFPATYRPPLFNFLAGGAMAVFGSGFWVLQALNVIFGTLAVLLTYLVARKIFAGKEVAEISALFVAINPVLVSLSIGGEVRMFFAVLFLASVLFYLERRLLLAGVFCGLSILTHQMGLGLALGFGLLIVFGLFRGKEKAKGAVLFTLPVVGAIVTLALMNFAGSTSLYVPLITDWGQMQKLEPPSLENMDWKAAGVNTMQNLVRTFLPVPLVRGEDGKAGLNFDFISNPNLNYNPLSAITTLVLLALALLLLFERWKAGKTDEGAKVFACLLAGALLLAVLSAHFPGSYAYSFLFGVSFLVVIFGAGRLLQEKGKMRWLIFALAALLLLSQFVIFVDRGVEKNQAEYWLDENTGKDARIMSSDCLEIAFYTGRACFVKPNENAEIVRQTAEKYGIDYFVQRTWEERVYSSEPVYSDEKWEIYKI